ncbi:PREDICTED: TATA-binding protein-associated factor 172-like isoform X1 [Priapulus caudatus]|uniref:TATA-binding protein-associated factor 172-like isoform X1 n=1 Tax=Priapulus caudatus TaxID=37621 RepID=A0ABM1ENS2_PRICU|nr:PREDICTED: TATA-binding protein-associated factor 172-like isoform X1 [Priapulus caudatus]
MATQRRGAQFGLSSMAQYFGAALFDKLPVLWEAINHCSLTQVAASSSQNGLSGGEEQARELANSLHVLETVGPALHPQLHDKLLGLSLRVCDCLRDRFTAVRHRAARCLAMLAKVCGLPAMTVVLEQVLPLLGATDSDVCRQGAVEALANVIELLDFEIVPYIVLLVLPVLGRISDHNENIRLMATQCFASLIRLMPLESGIVDPPELKPCLVEQKARQRCFMQQLLDSNKADDYKVPVPIHAELRKYQQDGVNWLAFLNKYKLHGILCDDMGLGKTLQSLCILAGDHHLREKAYKETGSADCMPLPSIVVCPPTLTGHWVYEIQKFVACQYLNPLHYTGPPVERARLKPQLRRHNLVIASYDIVRNDIDFFSGVKWNYCILDEGHIIKNGKTKISKAVKQLQACHRLILSGTPIQNNVLELWSLFDFLMPGLLGSERAFTARYGRPILQSRDAKSSMKEQEAGVLAMEALHRQVLPFLLRRMKDDVLQDLPPKIMQDYYCELSTLQVQLYEDFAKSRARVDAEEQMGASEAARPHSHVFQCLQYLRKVCNHPLLVLQPDHPLYRQIADQLDRTATSLCSLQHSGKLVALRQLLQDCGIGVGERAPAEAVVGEHRALVFCQFKSMLDIVEKHLLKPTCPRSPTCGWTAASLPALVIPL